MRRWRVGSMSMGLALILLGVLLFISQVSDRPAIELFTIWWPVILIILGLEILAHPLLLRKQEPVLKYDFVSIVFAGLIGMVGIACTVVTASGLFRELEFAVAAESRTFDLPAAVQPVDGAIKRIVLNPGTHRINLEASTEDDVRIFGTYRATVARGDEPPIR
jgi:hypothetical protein